MQTTRSQTFLCALLLLGVHGATAGDFLVRRAPGPDLEVRVFVVETNGATRTVTVSASPLRLPTEGRTALPAGYKGIEDLTEAAKQGVAEAQSALGKCCEDGAFGADRSPQEAAKWYERAAQGGDVVAQNNLGCLYVSGDGVPQNFQLARHWLATAASQGYAPAQGNLGYCYFWGLPDQDINSAITWLSRAAGARIGLADFYLGLIWLDRGNAPLAYDCLSHAVAHGYERGRELRDLLRASLPKEQLGDAQRGSAVGSVSGSKVTVIGPSLP